MSAKILVIGSVDGQFQSVFEKVDKLNQKNHFTFVIIVGHLFVHPESLTARDEGLLDELVNGNFKLPLPMYFTLTSRPLPSTIVQRLKDNENDVCENLHYIGKRTTFKSSDGVRIVALGGSLDPNIAASASPDTYDPFYILGDAKTLHGANKADILITSDWPAQIQKGSQAQTNDSIPQQQCIADLCAALKPRYHFSASPSTYFEREPFFHSPKSSSDTTNTSGYPITRFMSLAPFAKPMKEKCFFAFTLDTTSPDPTTLPPGVTASPFFTTRKRPTPSSDTSAFSRFNQNHSYHDSHRPSKRPRQPPPGPESCFFCIGANPNVEDHLVVSLADESYLALAKGPLTMSTTFANLPCPAHLLIVPMAHTPTLQSIEDPTTRSTTRTEMTHYANGLCAMAAANQLGAVLWEVKRAHNIHTHWQYLPVRRELVERGLLRAAFEVEAENERYPKFSVREDEGSALDGWDEGGDDDGDEFRVCVWRRDEAKEGGEVKTRRLVMRLALDAGFRFDINFGRRVMAKLLELDGRMNWRDCAQTKQEEVADAEASRTAFKEFDFTLE